MHQCNYTLLGLTFTIMFLKQCQVSLLTRRRAQLALGWMTSRVMPPTICRGVGQASHMPPLSAQQWWVPGGTKIGELWITLAAESTDCIRESSDSRVVIKVKVVVQSPDSMTMHVQQTLPSPGKVGTHSPCNYWSNLGSVHQVPITAGWTEAV